MNKHIKIHKSTSPAFHVGEKWISISGHVMTIQEVRIYQCASDPRFDADIIYSTASGTQGRSNVYKFQLRHTHIADLEAAK